MKLRYFYKLDKNNKPMPGSNISGYFKPNTGHWKEILTPCCNPPSYLCTCGPRYWVQIDGLGLPVPTTLIKRDTRPTTHDDKIKYMEIAWMSPCCSIDSP